MLCPDSFKLDREIVCIFDCYTLFYRTVLRCTLCSCSFASSRIICYYKPKLSCCSRMRKTCIKRFKNCFNFRFSFKPIPSFT